MVEQTTKHPLWQEVVDIIADEVAEKGYGIFYPHERLMQMLDIRQPKTIPEYTKAQFQYLNDLDALRDELLQEHNMYLENKKGDGYIVIHPDNHNDASDKQLIKARKMILKANKILVCVEESLLSNDAKNLRIEKIKKVAFLRGAFRKRTFPMVNERKQLGQ